MSQHSIIDFLPDVGRGFNCRGDVWDEAGRAIEAGYRAPRPIDLPLAIVGALTLPLFLQRRLESAFAVLVWP